MNECVKDVKAVRLDISFKSPSHTGLQTTELVCVEEIASEYLWDQIQNYILLIFITLDICYVKPVIGYACRFIVWCVSIIDDR